jgi:hypothetical protein
MPVRYSPNRRPPVSDSTASPPPFRRGALIRSLAPIAALLAVAGWGPDPKPVVLVPVLVASRDIPLGTRLTWENLPALVETRIVSEDSLPLAYVRDVDELVGRRFYRTLRAGETFNPMYFYYGLPGLSEDRVLRVPDTAPPTRLKGGE